MQVCEVLLMCDRYWETLLEMIYPRFEHILQLNIENIRDCDPQKLGHIDVTPHYVRSQSIVCSVLAISGSKYGYYLHALMSFASIH